MDTSAELPVLLQNALLTCGILASLLRVATDVLAGLRWKGYSFMRRSISELVAHGAPTRPLVLWLELVFGLLLLAFSFAIWQLSGQNPLMRVAASLIAANALINAGVSLFLPMRIRPGASASASTIHVALMATGVLFFLLAIGFGGAANENWFRYYSYGTLLVYILLTVARFVVPAKAPAGPPSPTTGVQERTMVLGYLLWIVVLAIFLLSSR